MDSYTVRITLESFAGATALAGTILGLCANALNAKATPADRVDWPDLGRDHTLDEAWKRGERTVASIRARSISNLSIVTLFLSAVAAIASGHGDAPLFASIVLGLAVGLVVYAVIIGQPLYGLTRRLGLYKIVAETMSRAHGNVVPQNAQKILDAALSANDEDILASEKKAREHLNRLKAEEENRKHHGP